MAFGNTVKDGSGAAYWLLVDSSGRLMLGNSYSASVQSDVTNDDSDKTFTVPASTEWIIKAIRITFTSTATAGNRQLVVQYRDDSDNVLFEVRVGAVQAASLTRYYQLADGMPNMTAFIDTDYLSTPLPQGITLPAGYDVRVYDKAAVAAAADDMHVRMIIESRSV